MDASRAAGRHRERAEELCAAALRALSGRPDLHFRGGELASGRRRIPMPAPHLRPADTDAFGSFRGATDGMALRLAHSDPLLHRARRPREPVARLVFELLEQFRCESLAGLPGVVANLRRRHTDWSLACHAAGVTETDRGLLLYTVAQICRSRVTAQPVVAETEDLLEATRFALVPALGHDLGGLRRTRHDQAAYATHALAIAHAVDTLLGEPGADTEDGEDSDRPGFALITDPADEADGSTARFGGTGGARDDGARGYRVFTTAYDVEQPIVAAIRPALLAEYRERLDRRIAQQRVNLPWLARRLRTLLADPAVDGWQGGQEDGHLDRAALTRLVTAPMDRRLFRSERIEPVTDCLVTFLVDCSGSMTGHAEAVTMLVDVLARALDLAGARSEILGFTTRAWNGGRALRDWRRAGQPSEPGRLAELCHLVVKDADTPWRRARRSIAALLRTELYREGVDGEAVAWACRRAAGRAERRRMLVVISDGSPMERATARASGEEFLSGHLKSVVAEQESLGTRIRALGVGLDLSAYYTNAHALDLSAGVHTAVLREVLDTLAGHRHH